MTTACPSCTHELQLARPKPGRFTFKCPACSAQLQMTVPDDPAGEPRVELRAPTAVAAPAGAGRSRAAAAVATGSSSGSGETVFQGDPAPALGAGGPSDDDWLSDVLGIQPAPSAASNDALMATVAATQPGPEPFAPQAGRSGEHPSGSLEETLAFTPLPDSSTSRSDELVTAVPERLGGHEILKRIGKGGMGAVYLARQLSLGRNVALKVIAPSLASNPTLVARFTREAYAAAQLVHHNIVQIYDFGEDRGIHYFSMEYVQGQTLGELIKEQGPIEPKVAVGYILQAARGLKVAHDQGLIHRDIKPDNLMLDRYGVIKVADLGLVKSIGLSEEAAAQRASGGEGSPAAAQLEPADESTATLAQSAVGTPAYMAPEQARDATQVDHRADIYSLGCTFYSLVTGRPPFQGKSVIELLTKHAHEPVTPPELVVKGIPQIVSAVIMKMVAKEPAARYADLGEVIGALEALLGVSPELPSCDEGVTRLAETVQELGVACSYRLKRAVLVGFEAVCGIGIMLALTSGNPSLAGLVLGLGLFTPLAYGLVAAIAKQSPLWLKTRQYLLESSAAERFAIAAVVLLCVSLLVLQHVLLPTLGILMASLAAAAVAYKVLDRSFDREPVAHVQEALRNLRQRGFDEDALRKLIAERAGKRFEAIRSALFGNEERLAGWQRWGRGEWERARPRLAAWHDAAFLWIEVRLRARQEARARRQLERIEQESFRAQGLSEGEARRKARRAAEALVAQASALRAASVRASQAVVAAFATREGQEQVFRKIHEVAEKPERILNTMERGLLARRSDESLTALIGPRTRLVAGIIAVLAYLIWLFQNGLHGADEANRPLWLPLVPSVLTGMVRDANAGIAGVILIASALYRGWRISLLVLPAAAIALAGSTFGLPAIFCLLAALALATAGFVFGRVGGEGWTSLE